MQYSYQFAVGYDFDLLGLAIFVCAVASLTVLNILGHVCRTSGYMRGIWLWIAAAASGFGIWATQFITMLAYEPDVPSGYNLGLTLLSLFTAILLTGAGLSLVASTSSRCGRSIGGAIVGVGIGATHYIGTAAYEVAGRIYWDPALVAASLGFAVAVAATALLIGLLDNSFGWRLLGAALLAVAICGHNFIAMRAARL